jgi:hypothetical protein
MKQILIGIFSVCMIAGCKSPKHTVTDSMVINEKEKQEKNSLNNNAVSDTLNYLQQVFRNKDKFIGQPFSSFLSELPYKVKSYYFGISNIKGVSTYISISFDEKQARDIAILQKSNPIIITVEWRSPLPGDTLAVLLSKSHGKWLEAEQEYYGNKIVKDIFLLPKYK